MATATTTEAGGDVVSVIHIGPRGLDHDLKAVAGRSGNPRIKCDRRSILLAPRAPEGG